ncbi:MAG: GNAT family N-acetyltransferase [Zavarzinia sp.]|nr:GNAT family N-acetyltransferase [Zavarzinia sp.]
MVQLIVTFMEMLATPKGAQPCAPGCATVRREVMARADYLQLYRAVGDPLHWDDHLTMSAEALDAFLADPANHVHVLRLSGAAGGFCEFTGVGGPEVQLTHFGLAPGLQGRGLGPYLLHVALSDVWTRGTRRVWLHTDNWDHPKAIATYAHAGFRVFDRHVQAVAG